MEFQALLDLFAGFGWQGLGVVGVILGAVVVAKKSGVVATGNQARAASIILAAVMQGLADNPESETAMLTVLSVVLAGLAHNALEWLGDKWGAPWLVNLLGVNK